MKIVQTTIQKTFVIEHKHKTHVVDFAVSDGPTGLLLNRNHFEVRDSEGEEIGVGPKVSPEEERLAEALVRHAVRHFFRCDRMLLKEVRA